MKAFYSLLCVFALVMLTGCNAPTIDASSKISLEASLERVSQSLSVDERAEFGEAFGILAMHAMGVEQINMFSPPQQSNVNPYELEERLRKAIHGKTAKQIIAEAKKIRGG